MNDDEKILQDSSDEELTGYLKAQEWNKTDAEEAQRELNLFFKSIPPGQESTLADFDENQIESNPSDEVHSSQVENPLPVVSEVKQNSTEYDPLIEEFMIQVEKGVAPSTAMAALKIPNIPAARRKLILNMIGTMAQTYLFQPDVVRGAIDAYSMKFFLDAAVKGDSDKALQWAKEIKRDSKLGYDKGGKAIIVSAEDARKFLQADVVDVEFIDEDKIKDE